MGVPVTTLRLFLEIDVCNGLPIAILDKEAGFRLLVSKTEGSGGDVRSWPGQTAERPQENEKHEGNRQGENDGHGCRKATPLYRHGTPSSCSTIRSAVETSATSCWPLAAR
jgi:hypothetical protein